MNNRDDITELLVEQVKNAISEKTPLVIEAGGSKKFYGLPQSAELNRLNVSAHSGIIDYSPDELVITARAGTRLSDINQLLRENNQILAFEPPDFSGCSTIGGVVASGISGPRRPYSGAVRDYILGVRLLTGSAKVLTFGGQVMKNVAGYDVSRLIVGAMGTLGVILDVSIKTLPAPELERTYSLSASTSDFQKQLQALSRNTPLSASALDQKKLMVRFSGSEEALKLVASQVEGDESSGKYWVELNTLDRFADVKSLWRVSLAPASQLLLEESAVIDWGGGVRWLTDPYDNPRDSITDENGHATLVKYDSDLFASELDVFHPLSGPVLGINQKLKHQFDPYGIFNPNRMYRGV